MEASMGNGKKKKPLVSIIVLAYNHLEYTKLCIESIYKYTSHIDFELIAVNNGSSDGTKEYFESLPGAKVINFEKNVGQWNGFNAGVKASRGRYISIVGNDTILTTNWMDNLLKCIKSDKKIGMAAAGANVIDNHQMISADYSNLEEMQQFAKEYNKSNPKKWEERIRIIPTVCIIRPEVFKKAGYFDPTFRFGEYGDDDFCFRVRRAGYKLIFAGDTFIHHFGSVTTDIEHKKFNSLAISRQLFMDKYGLDIIRDGFYNAMLVDAIEYRKKQAVKILGINTFCGCTPLQIKNRFKTIDVEDVYISTFTEDPKYITDLKTISESVFCGSLDNIRQFYRQERFDYIVLEEGLERHQNIEFIFRDLKNLLNDRGQLIFIMENESYFRNIIKLINGGTLCSENDFFYPCYNKDKLIKLFETLGYKNITPVGCQIMASEDDKKIIDSMIDLPGIKNKEISRCALSIAYFVFSLEVD
ncbi:GT2 family glycosyltransferase [Fonticella tunisiensis]|uniref:GT2 family glycosyltransferase n=2 Tax=Fonticella tunisiensis TaxID=1096341 RepID=A0A4R7KSG1_9CLOT|nr:GT2 family glycosyltransferase [Fonticella tunisiensis]